MLSFRRVEAVLPEQQELLKVLEAPEAGALTMRTVFEAQRRWLAMRSGPNEAVTSCATIDVLTGHFASGASPAEAYQNFVVQFGRAATGTFSSAAAQTAHGETRTADEAITLQRVEGQVKMRMLEITEQFSGQFITIDNETGDDAAIGPTILLSKAKFSLIYGNRKSLTIRIGPSGQFDK